MSIVTEALESVEIPYTEDSWAPLKPPQAPAYATVSEEIEVLGDDRGAVLYTVHSATVELYDQGYADGKAARAALTRELMGRGVKFERHQPVYISTEKIFMTVFDIEDYITKESEQ